MEEFIEEFMNERPDEVDVLLPVTNDLRPENSYLAYAANISFAIKCTMVDLHGGTLELYQVHKLEREAYFIICVNQTVRYAIVQQGPYKIPIARVWITLAHWTATTGMTFWPNEYHTWIKLIGLPLNKWNDEDLHKDTARVGTIDYIMPYGLHAANLSMSPSVWIRATPGTYQNSWGRVLVISQSGFESSYSGGEFNRNGIFQVLMRGFGSMFWIYVRLPSYIFYYLL